MAGSLDNSNRSPFTQTRRNAPRTSEGAPVLFRLPTVRVDGVRMPQEALTRADATSRTDVIETPSVGNSTTYALPSFLASGASSTNSSAASTSDNSATTAAHPSAIQSTPSVAMVAAEHETGNWKSRLLNRLILVLLLCLIGVGIIAHRRVNLAEKARRQSVETEKELATNVELPPPPAIPSSFASTDSTTSVVDPTSESSGGLSIEAPKTADLSSTSDKGSEMRLGTPDLPKGNNSGAFKLEPANSNTANSNTANLNTAFDSSDLSDEPTISFGSPQETASDRNSNRESHSMTLRPSDSVGSTSTSPSQFQDFPQSQDDANARGASLEAPSLISQDTNSRSASYTETEFRAQSPEVLLAARKARLDNLSGNTPTARTNNETMYLTSQSQPAPYQPVGNLLAPNGSLLEGNAYPELPNSVQSTGVPNGRAVGPAITANPNRIPNAPTAGNFYPSNGGYTNGNVAPPRSGYGGVAPGGTPANYSSVVQPNGQPGNYQQPGNAQLNGPQGAIPAANRAPYQSILNQIQGQYIPENGPARSNLPAGPQNYNAPQGPNPYGPYNSSNVGAPQYNNPANNTPPMNNPPMNGWGVPTGGMN